MLNLTDIRFDVHVLYTLQIDMALLSVSHPRNVNETHERKHAVDLTLLRSSL